MGYSQRLIKVNIAREIKKKIGGKVSISYVKEVLDSYFEKIHAEILKGNYVDIRDIHFGVYKKTITKKLGKYDIELPADPGNLFFINLDFVNEKKMDYRPLVKLQRKVKKLLETTNIHFKVPKYVSKED